MYHLHINSFDIIPSACLRYFSVLLVLHVSELCLPPSELHLFFRVFAVKYCPLLNYAHAML